MSMPKKKWISLLRRARAGDRDAQWELGAWFDEGLADDSGSVIVRPNAAAAVRWYRRAADAGDACAQINLGNCLSEGRGIQRNDDEALLWYKRALRQQAVSAANNIAVVYRDRGNQRRALYWYRRAAACGDEDAWVEIGGRYYTGVGVRRNAAEAVRCFRKAVASETITQAGREEAMHRLGVAYLEGRGVRRSLTRALLWFNRANRDGDRPKTQTLIDLIRKECAL